jgi:diguanylate cyclase (GGDEF)-like protein
MSGEADAPLVPGQRRLRAVPLDVPGVELVAELGRGARSVVYRIRCDGREFALKTLAELGDDFQAPTFAREAALLASLDHPGLVRIYEVGESSGWPYIIMDLVEGRSLDVLLAGDRLADHLVAKFGAQVADALAAAHSAGLVHRDVKPSNIIVEPSGRVRLIDFGLAARFGGEATNVAAGTFIYSAPEQTGMLHRAIDGRADLYALGIVLFECLTKVPPFEAADSGELIRLHLTATAPDLRMLRPDIGPAMADVISRLLAKDPDDRYQTAEALRSDLARIADGERDFPLAVGARSSGARTRPMVGRDQELGKLLARWEGARAGHGGAVLIEGAPGAGKTRLGYEFARRVRASGQLVLTGKSNPDDPVPLGPLRSAVERHLRDVLDLPPVERSAAISGLRKAVGDGLSLLGGHFPLLATLLVGESEPEAAGTPAGDGERAFGEAMAGFLIGLAEQHCGATLHLEDVQWWDEATRRVVRNLASLLQGSQLLLIATGRSDPEHLKTLRSFTVDLSQTLDLRLALDPLPQSAIASLVASLLGARSVPVALAARLAAHGAGNPLAVSEYVRAALDAGLLRPHRGTWTLDEAGLEKLALPEDIIELLLRRIDRLGLVARYVLTVAAAVGNAFQADLVASVASQDAAFNVAAGCASSSEVWSTVAAAVVDAARHLLVEPVGGRYVFLHDRIREALLAELDEAGLRRLHQTIAETLERGKAADDETVYAVAAHYLRGETDRTPDRVFRSAFAAGVRALAEHAAAEAYDLLSKAEAAAKAAGIGPDERFHATYGTAAIRTGRPAVARDQLRRALELERDPMRRATLHARMADAYHLRWEERQAMAEASQGLAEIGLALPRNLTVLLITAVILKVAGHLISRVPERIRLARGTRRERYRLQNELIGLMAQGAAITMRTPLTVALTWRSAYTAARVGGGPQYALSSAAQAMVSAGAGQQRAARRRMAVAIAMANQTADPRLIALVNCMAAVTVDVMSPTTVTSGQTTRSVLERHGRWLGHGDYMSCVDNLSGILLLRGYAEEAAAWYQRGRQRAMRDDAVGNEYAAFGARIAALRGRAAEAASRMRKARELAAGTPDDISGRLAVALAAVHVVLEQGELGQPFEEALAEFKAMGKGPRQVWASQRVFWVYQAFGRIAQAAAAHGTAPPSRDAGTRGDQHLVAVAKAVRELRKVANGPVLRGYYAAAAANLEVLRGQPRRALRLLGREEGAAGGIDAPLVDYEVALARARAYLALGSERDATLQANHAIAIAVAHRWRVRVDWVRSEFGIEATSSREPQVAVAGTPSGEPWAAEVYGRRLQALHQVSLAAASVLDPRQLSRVALDEVVRIFAAERAFLFLVDLDSDRILPYLGRDSSGKDLDQLADYGASLVERVRESEETFVVTGSEEGAALGSQSSIVHGLRSIMVAPMRIKGRMLGVVYLDSRAAKGVFTRDDVDILLAITNQVGIAITTARTAQLELEVHAAKRERDVAETLRLAMTDIAASLDPDEVGRRLVAAAAQATHGDSGAVIYRMEDGSFMTIVDGERVAPVSSGDPVIGQLITASSPRTGIDAASELGSLYRLLGSSIRAWLAVPLLIRGEHRGLMVLGDGACRPYTDSESKIAAALAGQGMTAYENAVLFRRIEELAVRDGLTGLYNRRHFFDSSEVRFRERQRRDRAIAAVMVDIDNFKAINDTYGHAAGDDVIREVAYRLRTCLRVDDLICRYGGEEFAILLAETSAEQARVVAERLRATIAARPVPSGAGPQRVTVSVGLAGPAVRERDLHSLLNRADDALYAAKRAGRNRVAGD